MGFDWASLSGLIHQLFTDPPVGGGAPANPPSTQFQGDWPPASFDGEVANAWSPSNPNGFPGLMEDIARLVNAVPRPGPVYHPQPSTVTVENVYELILTGAYVTPRSERVLARAAFSPKSDVSIRDLELAALAHANQVNAHAMAVAAANAHRLSSPSLGGAAGFGAGAASEPAVTGPVASKGMAAGVEAPGKPGERMRAALPFRGLAGDLPFDRLCEQARRVFDLAARGSVAGLSEFRPAYLMPSDFALASSASRWATLQTTFKTTEGRMARCSLRFLRLDIVRPWFNGLLIAMPGWKIRGYAAGQLNNLFPLLTTSMIVSRDLVVSTDNTTGSLRLPGLHRLGWFSELQPPIPPLGDLS